MNLPIIKEKSWYSGGLPFKCTGCGKCCSGSPGYVWVTLDEIDEMATFLDISRDLFVRKYIRQVGKRYSLTELKKENFACVFLKDNKCQVYGARPRQCRTYPFWQQNLTTEQAWEKTRQECEGIAPDAPIIPFEQIQEATS